MAFFRDKNNSRLLLLVFLLSLPVLAQEIIFTDSFESLPAEKDLDKDGLSNGEEEDLGTDPREPDTDGDGFGDGSEVAVGTDPLDKNSFPMTPPDPVTTASDPVPGITTTVFDSTAFLYTGDNPIQTGVAPDTIDLRRAAVIRGKVMTRNGAPLPTVIVSILNHPELGQTISRADGMFDLVVNGGGLLIVDYQLDGFLPAQRKVSVPWQNFVTADDVALIQLDPIVTTVDFSAPGTVQMAMSSQMTDEDGTRQAVLMIPKGTTAQLVMSDDSTVPITSLDIRATEYTVGTMGPTAMPGTLPPSSGYTYAVEMSADEALSGGAKAIEFNQPLPFYVDDFLGFPAGTPVPTGYYDRQLGRWVPQLNGRVIKLLGKTGELADLDVDGDGAANTGVTLTELGITDDERAELAQLYSAGSTFWRVPMSHFSPWDHNWPFGPPADAVRPSQSGSKPEALVKDGCNNTGSIIGCQNQSLGERVQVTGTSLSLNYLSSNMPGHKLSKRITLSVDDAVLPVSLKRIDSTISVAGLEFPMEGFPEVGDDRVFIWDGNDAYGRPIQGSATATVSIGYVYDGDYRSPGAPAAGFGLPGEFSITGSTTRQEVTLSQAYDAKVENLDARGQGLGGWTLGIHHQYDPVGRTLYFGDGRKRGDSERSDVRLFAGYVTGAHGWTTNSFFCQSNPDLCKDGMPANETAFTGNKSIAFAADGTAYFTQDQLGYRVRKVSPDGIVSSLVPISEGYDLGEFNGDGGPASLAKVEGPRDVAVGLDGSVYIAEQFFGFGVIRKVDPDGIITTFAGGGDDYLTEGPATSLKIGAVWAIDTGPDGSLYINDHSSSVIWRITPDGYMSIVAGRLFSGDARESGVPATQTDIAYSLGMAVGPDGSIYLGDTSDFYLWRITPDGIINKIAGTGVEAEEIVNGPALSTAIGDIRGIAVDSDGSVWFMNYDIGVIRRLDTEGNLSTVVGRGDWDSDFVGLNGPALQAILGNDFNTNLAIGPDSNLYISYWTSIWSINPRFSGLSGDEILMASEDGLEVYQFSSSGRHLRTLNSLTGAVIYEFAYDANSLLTSVTDGFGNVTTIERDLQGNPKALVAPLGQRSELQLDVNGFLSQVTNPAGESVSFQYTEEGLLTQLTRPDNQVSTYTYDDLGLLIGADDGSGYTTQLERTEFKTGFEIKRTSGMGAETTYRVEELLGGDILLTNTDAAGAVTQVTQGVDGTRSVVSPNGATETQTIGPDPRLGMRSMGSEVFTITSPGGKSLLVESRREVEMANISDLFSITSFTESRIVGGRTITEMYDAATRKLTVTTPEGRVSTTTSDEFGRTIEVDPGSGLDIRTWSYDADGQVDTIVQGTHSLEYHYDLQGRMTKQTDVLGREQLFAYDDADRLTTLTTPGSRTYGFTYDSIGLMRTITLPSGHVHELDYAPFGGLIGYTPPDAGVMAQTYDNDRHRVSVVLADGRTQSNTQDSKYRSDAIIYPEATVSFSYHGLTHQFDEIVWTPTIGAAHKQAFTFDGDLLTGLTLDLGGVSDEFSYIRDDAWRLSGTQLNVEQMLNWTYNDDDQPVSYGPFSITRDGPAGALSKYSDGTITIDYALDSMGRLTGRTHTIGTSVIYDLQLDHATGSDLISQRIETISGSATTLDYDYSLDNEVISVTDGLTEIESYAYDNNGNRNQANGVVANFDNQDRLISYNGVDYSFDANGFLSTRGADSFTYSTRGELLSATVGGDTVTYSYDAVGRQVARTQGADTTQYLFGDPNDPFRLSASRAPDGTLSQYYYDQAGLLIGLERAGERFYVITDQVGSPRLIVNNLAVIQREISYNVFGETVSDTGGFDLVIGFGGGLFDELTSLNRMGLRDYDAEAGRWTSRDPILFRGGQFNLYVYANNNPVNLRDPSGLICIGASAYAVAGAGSKLCYKDGKWSACLEVGLGAGGGLSLDLFGKTAPRADADYVNATASVGCGPAQLSVGLKLNDCGDLLLSGSQQFAVGGVGGGNKREKNFTTGQRTDTNFGMGPPGTGATAQLNLIGIDCPGGCPNPLGTSFDPNKNDPKKAGTLSCKAQVTAVAGICTGSDFF